MSTLRKMMRCVCEVGWGGGGEGEKYPLYHLNQIGGGEVSYLWQIVLREMRGTEGGRIANYFNSQEGNYPT